MKCLEALRFNNNSLCCTFCKGRYLVIRGESRRFGRSVERLSARGLDRLAVLQTSGDGSSRLALLMFSCFCEANPRSRTKASGYPVLVNVTLKQRGFKNSNTKEILSTGNAPKKAQWGFRLYPS